MTSEQIEKLVEDVFDSDDLRFIFSKSDNEVSLSVGAARRAFKQLDKKDRDALRDRQCPKCGRLTDDRYRQCWSCYESPGET